MPAFISSFDPIDLVSVDTRRVSKRVSFLSQVRHGILAVIGLSGFLSFFSFYMLASHKCPKWDTLWDILNIASIDFKPKCPNFPNETVRRSCPFRSLLFISSFMLSLIVFIYSKTPAPAASIFVRRNIVARIARGTLKIKIFYRSPLLVRDRRACSYLGKNFRRLADV